MSEMILLRGALLPLGGWFCERPKEKSVRSHGSAPRPQEGPGESLTFEVNFLLFRSLTGQEYKATSRNVEGSEVGSRKMRL